MWPPVKLFASNKWHYWLSPTCISVTIMIIICSWASTLGKSELRRKPWTNHGCFCSWVKECGLCLVLAYPWWWTWIIPDLFPPKNSDQRRGSYRPEARLFPEEHISLYFSGWRRGVLGGGLLQNAEQFQMGRAVFSVQKSNGFLWFCKLSLVSVLKDLVFLSCQ